MIFTLGTFMGCWLLQEHQNSWLGLIMCPTVTSDGDTFFLSAFYVEQ